MTIRKKLSGGEGEDRPMQGALRLVKKFGYKPMELREPVFTGADIDDLSGAIGIELAPGCKTESVAACLNAMLEDVGNRILDEKSESLATIKRRWLAIEKHAESALREFRALRSPSPEEFRRFYLPAFDKRSFPATPPGAAGSSEETDEALLPVYNNVHRELFELGIAEFGEYEKWLSNIAYFANQVSRNPPVTRTINEKITRAHYVLMVRAYRDAFGELPKVHLDGERAPKAPAVQWCAGIRKKALLRLPACLIIPFPEVSKFFVESRGPNTMAERISQALSAIKNGVAAAAKPK